MGIFLVKCKNVWIMLCLSHRGFGPVRWKQRKSVPQKSQKRIVINNHIIVLFMLLRKYVLIFISYTGLLHRS